MNQSLLNMSDKELIQRICLKKSDPIEARAAFTTFYNRHKEFVYRNVKYAEGQLTGFAFDAEDIVVETFSKVWSVAAASYVAPSNSEPESLLWQTQGWLSKIAKNLVKDKIKSRKNSLQIAPSYETEALVTEEEKGNHQLNIPLMKSVQEKLSERDAAIVWFKIQYYDPETGQSHPPNDAMQIFCKEWNLKPATLRKAYERALKTLSQALDAVAES